LLEAQVLAKTLEKGPEGGLEHAAFGRHGLACGGVWRRIRRTTLRCAAYSFQTIRNTAAPPQAGAHTPDIQWEDVSND